MDFRGSRGIGAQSGKERRAALMETFARFQAGFLSSDFSSYFIDFQRFQWIPICLIFFIVFRGFRGMGA